MFETYLTVVGNVVTNPQRRETQTGEEVISFRVGSTARYRPADSGQWRDGSSLFLTVSCWRRLIAGVGASVKKGTPVIVHGQVRSRQYTTKDGEVRTDYEMRASAVGLDLARSIVQRLDRKVPAAVAEAGVTRVGPGSEEDHGAGFDTGTGDGAEPDEELAGLGDAASAAAADARPGDAEPGEAESDEAEPGDEASAGRHVESEPVDA